MTFTITVSMNEWYEYAIGLYFVLSLAFFLYVGIMNLVKNKNSIDTFVKILGIPWFLLGVLLNVSINLTLGTVIFLDVPREFLLSKRLRRIRLTRSGWRYRLASKICTSVLNPYDLTKIHC